MDCMMPRQNEQGDAEPCWHGGPYQVLDSDGAWVGDACEEHAQAIALRHPTWTITRYHISED